MGDYVPFRRDDGDEPTLEEITQRGEARSAVDERRAERSEPRFDTPIDALPDLPDAARYEVRRRIGAGAMGEVNLCLDRHLGRDLAMKVIRRDHSGDPTARLRFQREARVQGQLEHPAIVPVHDFGVTADGGLFFTMKRVQGESLRAILDGLRRGDVAFVARYGQHRLLSAFGTVCLAVALAHSRGIVHRDIKPANIMFGDYGEVYLLDWGIAHVRRQIGATDETWDASVALPREIQDDVKAGELLGTVGYMPPEQMRGEPIDARADVYALGATLFEILTLERLHPRDAVLALQSTAAGVDARPRLRTSERPVAPDLEELCVRALASDPADRPSSAREMHGILERVLEGDRDLARRRQLSLEHTQRARDEALRAFTGRTGAFQARDRAIQEVHRAIVLDAGNHEAVEILTRLAREPTGEVTHAADDALFAATRQMRRTVARAGAVLFLGWVFGIACGAMLGLKSPTVLEIGALILFVGSALSWYRTRYDSGWLTFATLVLADTAAAITGAAFSPLILVPGILACTAVAFTVASTPIHGVPERESGSRIIRLGAMGLGVLAFLVPIALEYAGIVPPSIVFRDGAIVLLPRAIDFPPHGTLLFLVVVNVAVILVPSLLAARVRDLTIVAERDAFVSLAQMRQLLPSIAKRVIEADPHSPRNDD